uniref:SWIM-type domain-containing protein n=1 Tax=Magallana gigas TaxID=29159 RepID=A0A8W8LEU1_MAGGI
MATREHLKKTNISILKKIATDLGIDIKKKKKDDLICDILVNSTSIDSLCPIVEVFSPIDPILTQFKENLPPFNKATYQLLGPSNNVHPPTLSFSSLYEFMISRTRQGGQSVQNFKGLDKSLKHFDAGDIQELSIANIDSTTVYVKAFCLASMKKQRYQVYLCITNTGITNKVDFAYCQCPIGLAQACSHIGGLLFAISNGVFTSSNDQSESCTSTLCTWKMPRSVNQKPTPLSNLNLSKPQLEKDNVTATSPLPHGSAMANFDPRHSEDRKNDIDWSLQQLAELKVISSQTGMAHLWNVPDLGAPTAVENEMEVESSVHPLHLKMEKMVFSKSNVPPPMIDQELVSYIEKHTRAQRLSDLWKKLHLGRITSSIFGDVLQSGDKPTSLIQQILYGSNLDKYSKLPLAVQWGVDHEMDAKEDYLQIRRAIQVETNVQESGLTLCSTHSFLGASSDGRVVDNESTGLLEIKCPYSISGQNVTLLGISDIMSMNSKLFCLEVGELGPTLKKSHKYYAQVQGEMAIIGLPWVDFVVWTAAKSDNIFIERIYFNEQYVTNMLPKLIEFYMRHIYPLL